MQSCFGKENEAVKTRKIGSEKLFLRGRYFGRESNGISQSIPVI